MQRMRAFSPVDQPIDPSPRQEPARPEKKPAERTGDTGAANAATKSTAAIALLENAEVHRFNRKDMNSCPSGLQLVSAAAIFAAPRTIDSSPRVWTIATSSSFRQQLGRRRIAPFPRRGRLRARLQRSESRN